MGLINFFEIRKIQSNIESQISVVNSMLDSFSNYVHSHRDDYGCLKPEDFKYSLVLQQRWQNEFTTLTELVNLLEKYDTYAYKIRCIELSSILKRAERIMQSITK